MVSPPIVLGRAEESAFSNATDTCALPIVTRILIEIVVRRSHVPRSPLSIAFPSITCI